MKRHRAIVGLLLALLALPACDSQEDRVAGSRYFLRLEGTAQLAATCTIELTTDADTTSATFNGLRVPDEAFLGTVLGAAAICTKEQEMGVLRLQLVLENAVIDTAETSEPFGSASVRHP